MTGPTQVAIDGGPAGDAAVAWAARSTDSTTPLEIVAAVRAHHQYDWLVTQEAWTHLQEARRTVRRSGRSATIRLLYGDLGDALQGASTSARRIVVGSTEPGPLASLTHAALPLRLAGQTACELAIVPSGWTAQAGGEVIVGVADDTSSDAALHVAADEAGRLRATVRIVHAWAPPPVNLFDEPGSQRLYDQAAGAAAQLCEALTLRMRRSHPELTVLATATSHEPASALASVSSKAQLVVVGSHGKGAIGDLVVGSVGDDLIRALRCPMIIVPPNTDAHAALPTNAAVAVT